MFSPDRGVLNTQQQTRRNNITSNAAQQISTERSLHDTQLRLMQTPQPSYQLRLSDIALPSIEEENYEAHSLFEQRTTQKPKERQAEAQDAEMEEAQAVDGLRESVWTNTGIQDIYAISELNLRDMYELVWKDNFIEREFGGVCETGQGLKFRSTSETDPLTNKLEDVVNAWMEGILDDFDVNHTLKSDVEGKGNEKKRRRVDLGTFVTDV